MINPFLNSKKSFLKRFIVFLLILFWLLSGWPPLWQNPSFPPKIGFVQASTLTKTFTFDADTESWTATACGAAGATCAWQSSAGSPANGSLEEPETRKNKSGTWTWELSGISWESLGVPTGSVVTVVDGSYNHTMATCTNCNTTGGNTSGTLSIRDSGDTTTVTTLETEVSYTGATSWAARNASGAQSIGASYQASSTGIILRLSGSIQTNNVNGAAAVIRQDQISMVITYTTPVISVSISDGSTAYGTLAVNTNEDTTSSGLNDTQVATNDGDAAEDFNIKGQSSAAWTLGASAGSEQYVHSFCTSGTGSPDPCDSSPTWTTLTTGYTTLASNIATSGTQRFDLKITTPTSTTATTQQSVNVTIQAVLH
ncbi:MAG: hypothetical protein Q8P13_04230 [bacterium]|nr:hypothetical protein [bacterium]